VAPSLTTPCDKAVELPEQALSSAETARLWGRDRQSLGDCGARHRALAAAAEALERQGE